MRIAVLGGGVMGELLASGLLTGLDERPDVVIAEKVPERAAALQQSLGVDLASPADAVVGADVVILVVKPQDLLGLLDAIGPQVGKDALVLSIAAGITTEAIEARLNGNGHVVRVMPNTPARVGMAVTGISAGSTSAPQHVAVARELMQTVGMVVEVPESQQDAVTALSGSGPAYVVYLAQAMLAAGVELGLDEAIARDMVAGTLRGAAELLATSDESARELRARVTSPNGTTAAATAVFDERGLADVVRAGMVAARDRGRELAAG